MPLSLRQRDELMEKVRRGALDVTELCVSAVRYPRISLDGLVRAKKILLEAIDAASELDAE